MIPFNRDFFLEMALESIADIVVPEGDLWRRFGEALASEIGKRAGQSPQVGAVEGGFDRPPPSGSHRILVGTVHTNPGIAWLYRRKHTLVDDFYPGPGGWVIQTVHNPSNVGWNALIIGFSDPEMREEVLAAFRRLLAGCKGVLGYLNQVQTRLVVPRLSALECQRWKRKARAAFRTNTGRDALERGIESGLVYALTGHAEYLDLFVFALRHYHGLVRRAGGEWEFEHMLFPYAWIWRLAWVWDMVEESPLLDPADRGEVATVLRGLAGYTSRLVYFGDPRMREPSVRQNHPTFAALSLFFAARYFRDYYGDHSFDGALEGARLIFDGQRGSYKPDDDANGYCWLAPAHLLIHDLARDDFRWIEGGHLRQVCEYAELTTDNLRAPVGFGDVTRYTPPDSCTRELRFLLSAGSAFYRQGAFRRLLSPIPPEEFDLTPRHGEMGNYLVDSVGHYALDLESSGPVLAAGVQRAPLTAGVHRLVEGQSEAGRATPARADGSAERFPLEKCFDKLALRAGYGTGDEYLLMDGLAGCVHGHEDAASILRLTWKDRMWLTEGDYIRSLPKFHNGLVSVCAGESGPVPKLASLEFLHRDGDTTCLQLRVGHCNGVHWRRTIIWRRGCWFLFVDSAELLQETDFVISLNWRLLGTVRRSDRATTCRQTGIAFRLAHGDSSVRSVTDEPPREIRISYGPFHREYPHASDPTRVLRQERRVERGRVGERVTFFNLLTCGDSREIRAWNLDDLGDGASRLASRAGDENWVVREGPFGTRHWETDSALVLVSDARVRLVHCRSVRFGGRAAAFGEPVLLEFRLDEGTARVVADRESAVSGNLFPPGSALRAGESFLQVDSALNFPSFTESQKPVEDLVGQKRMDSCPAPRGEDRTALFGQSEGCPSDLDWSAASSRLFVVENQRRCTVFAGSGRRAVFAAFRRSATVVRVIAVDGAEKVVIGGAGFLSLLDSAGAEQWQVRLPPSHYRIQRVNAITVARLEPAAEPSILVATDGWLVHCLDLDGRRKWVTQIHHHAARSLCVGDVDGDGRLEILVGTEYHTSDLLESDGRVRWTISGGPEFIALAFCDLDRDGILESVYGAESGAVCAVHSLTGEVLWTANLGDRAHLVWTVSGPVEPVLIAAGISGEIVRLDDRGRKVWRRNLGAAIVALEDSTESGTLIAFTRQGESFRLDSDGALLDRQALGFPVARVVPLGEAGRGPPFLLATPDGQLRVWPSPIPT